MKKCNDFRDLFLASLYGELNTEQTESFENHLAECRQCATEYSQMGSTLKIMDRRAWPEPTDWSNYRSRLSDRLRQVEKPVLPIGKWRKRLHRLLSLKPAAVYRTATVSVIIVIVAIISLLYLDLPISFLGEGREIDNNRDMRIERAELADLTDRYLERSKIILLGLVNYNLEEKDSGLLDLSYQKQISKELIQEAVFLKKEMTDKDQQKLIALVVELEAIMWQITELKAEYDLQGIELIRSEVDQRAILLKINLNELSEVN